MHQNRSVDVHRFSMVPRADIPRSTFKIEKALKSTFDAGYLVPVYLEEFYPGDHIRCNATMFCRLATPLFPLMDNLYIDSFFFFVPNRLVWTNWVRMMGEQDNPGDSISFTVPQQVSPVGGYAISSLQDYFGLPTVGQVAGGNTVSHSALPLRSYNLIWNTWFRSEDLQNSVTVDTGNGPDTVANYVLLRRGKRHDYFTSALPWPLKGGVSVSLPLGTSATVKTQASELFTGAQAGLRMRRSAGTLPAGAFSSYVTTGGVFEESTTAVSGATDSLYPTNLYADLSTATAATINQLRQAFQIQRVLERDARSGSRYVESNLAFFGVRSPDMRLQRPELLGLGSQRISINPVAQQTATGLTGGTTPLGTLAGVAQSVGRHNFSYSCTEHGHIIGLVSVRADLTYQQGLRKLWSRLTRYDHYLPPFANLGEQALLNKEIYCDGSANDALVFGYQERWSELRYSPSQITGLFRSTSAGTIDPWHAAQKFTALPTLNATFIQDTPPISRLVAVGAAANGQQLLFDSIWSSIVTRPLPMYSVPGLIDHL